MRVVCPGRMHACMSTKISTLASSARRTTEVFRTFSDDDPDLIDIGIPALREALGGFFGGTLLTVAAGTGVGKSRMALSMLLNASDVGGYISTEDPEEEVGVRILAHRSGVNSRLIRKKDLTSEDLADIEDALTLLELDEPQPLFAYCLGATSEDVAEAVEALAEGGARFIILDYLQKVRGAHDDRRNEVGRVMQTFHRACARHGVVAIMISQLSRLAAGVEPRIYHLKESGDIENESRLILLGHSDPERDQVVWHVAKSNFGGVGLRFRYITAPSGMLEAYSGDTDHQEGPFPGQEGV